MYIANIIDLLNRWMMGICCLFSSVSGIAEGEFVLFDVCIVLCQ
jgi:hypothetical protein